MHVYLYDQKVKDSRHASEMKNIENRLTEFGIAGRVIHLKNLLNPATIVEEEIRRGATTVVVVGDDETLGQVVLSAGQLPVLFGFVPVGKKQELAKILGIPNAVDAVDVLARRRKVKIDIGAFNQKFFFSQLIIPAAPIKVIYDRLFSVSSPGGEIELVVTNLQPYFLRDHNGEKVFPTNPQDGRFEAFLRPLIKKTFFSRIFDEPSQFPFSEMRVESNSPFVVVSDGKIFKEKQINIRLAPRQLEIVVGKDRMF